MNKPLAVFTPAVGAPSETFIRRHVRDLLPNGTAVISLKASRGDGWDLPSDCPSIAVESIGATLPARAANGLKRRLGMGAPTGAVKEVGRFLKENNVRVLLGEYLDKSHWLLSVSEEQGIPLFVHAHGYDVSSKLRDDRWMRNYRDYNRAAGVLVMSDVCAGRLEQLGIDRDKVHVIPYGVDVPSKQTFRGGNQKVRCLAVGRMVTKKAPIILLDAFRRAIGYCPDLHLDYVGGGPLLAAARQFVSALGLSDYVTLHGVGSSAFVQSLMQESDIFLQHSMTDPESGDEEGLPVSILEAMASGLPVISTRHAGIPEAVCEGVTGFLVDEGDSVEMGQHIVALATDPGRRLEMGEEGWKRARARFMWETERSSLLEVMGLRPSAV